MSNLLQEHGTEALAALAGAGAGATAATMDSLNKIKPIAKEAENINAMQTKALKGAALGLGGLGLGAVAASRAQPLSEESIGLLKDWKAEQEAQGQFAHMAVANFLFDPSLLIDGAQHLIGGGGHALAGAGNFLQEHAQPLMLAGSSILGAKARGKAAKDVAETGAKIADNLGKAKRKGLLTGAAAAGAAGLVGGKVIDDQLEKRGAKVAL